MIVGMDFGTTNSGMAVYDGRDIQLLPLDPANTNPRVIRTALYVTNDQNVAVGRDALNRYFEQNSGRPIKMQRVWVGEIEVRGADMYFVRDVYVWVDALSPGRLFLSIKSGLRDADYLGTVIGQFFYPLEDLIAIYLSLTRLRAERLLDRPLREVVLGRPVRFATDPQADALAQQRLLTAAFRAGYEKVYLQYEPIAAAYHYAVTRARPQNILVFDFGGGTLDITVMRLDGRKQHQVLATGGVPIAGDIFDQKLVRAKLPPHFGEGGRYGLRGREMPIPKWIFNVFANWQTIMELQTPQNRQLLQEIAQTARKPRQIEALISMVANNYSLQMFDVAEQAKRDLSERIGAMLTLQGPGFNIYEMVTRTEFEQIIYDETQVIEQHLLETVQASGLLPSQIDAVIRTGGSSQIPIFQQMLQRHFGREKVESLDLFSSVTAGLGVYAHGIAAGEIEAQAHTPAEPSFREKAATETNVLSVNLPLLQRRLALQEGNEGSSSGEMGLAWLAEAGQLTAVTLPPERFTGSDPIPFTDLAEGGIARPHLLLPAGLDETLLLVTSHYRFILITMRQLLDLRQMGLTLAEFHHFRGEEQVCTLNRWPAVKGQSKLLLVTTRGYARAYNLDNLYESLEGPVPLQFDQPLPGLPLAVLGAQPDDQFIVVLGNGRAARWPLAALPLQGLQAINRRPEEKTVAAFLAQTDAAVVLATAAGYGKCLPAEMIAIPAKANSHGRVLIARPDVRAALAVATNASLWAATAHELRPISPLHLIPDPDSSTKSTPWLRLPAGAELLTLIQVGNSNRLTN
jgi:hypothetical chaperone protein